MNIEEIIKHHDPYIRLVASSKVPRNVLHAQTVADEIDELAQKARIATWQMSEKQPLRNVEALIRRVVHNEVVDIYRQKKKVQLLLLDEDGELRGGNPLVAQGESGQDPAAEIERAENFTECIAKVANWLLSLPHRQQIAMVCDLKDKSNDTQPLLEALKARGLAIDSIHWPKEEKDKQNLRASRSIARKKLNNLLHMPSDI